ncbi:ribonucleotide-diphosphate reductase subunit alpha [uncultured Clostridium sp.]|uniref:ATP cone domain-containing protein n=1 Tax=uncultured Clostridium sp. TaxID=59620 RepID=UPI000822C9F2|nr:ATP cone domain-containing protein [uncultured Clostridium sp.]SCI86210.1 ribonucleotide-diphosphate reductase subunit alpha [uncultured Clostridium sp.]
MQVIKKDGRLQELEANKIKVSILNATSETKSLLNESDINVLVKDIIKAIEDLRSEYGNTSSYEIIGVVVDILKKDGFEDVVSSYVGYSK